MNPMNPETKAAHSLLIAHGGRAHCTPDPTGDYENGPHVNWGTARSLVRRGIATVYEAQGGEYVVQLKENA